VPIPVPVVMEVDPPTPRNAVCAKRSRRNGATADSSAPAAKSLSVSDTQPYELAVALKTWEESRPWDGIRHEPMQKMLRSQAGESVWRQPVLQAAALLRQQAGTPSARDMHPFHAQGVRQALTNA
jgi:hypothetical protein